MGFIKSVGHGLKKAGEESFHGISEAGKTIGKGVQDGTDIIANGPMGIEMRNELNHLHGEVNGAISQYNNLHSQISAWQNPINNCGKQTSAILHQSSDYVHGIALNYSKIIDDNSLNIPKIQQLGNANIVKPLVDIPIPGDFGGFPSALIPGVEALQMMEGLINIFGGSITLRSQLSKARTNLSKAQDYVHKEQVLLSEMQSINDYFLLISNNVLDVFRRTTGLHIQKLAATNSGQLAATVGLMERLVGQITAVKGNAFTICRYIVNLSKEKNISSPSESQIQWIANKLFSTIPDMSSSFESEANVAIFVRNFFGGQLLTPAALLHLPEPPSNIKKYITESESVHETMSDPNSTQYDPPTGISLSDFPS